MKFRNALGAFMALAGAVLAVRGVLLPWHGKEAGRDFRLEYLFHDGRLSRLGQFDSLLYLMVAGGVLAVLAVKNKSRWLAVMGGSLVVVATVWWIWRDAESMGGSTVKAYADRMPYGVKETLLGGAVLLGGGILMPESEGKSKSAMSGYIFGFLPWIVYALVAGKDPKSSALVGLVAAAGTVFIGRRKGNAWDEMVIESSAVVFFGAMTWIVHKSPDSPLITYSPALVDAWLGATALASIVVLRPFTLALARKIAPVSVHDTAAFFRTNTVITFVWALSFAAAGGVLALAIRSGSQTAQYIVFVKVASFAVPAIFSSRYPKIAAKR
ncbi:hypothetical protein AB0N81_27495 [Streptomyces sp. NPDC093510]|uniref:hypothetical protein n=1 Tax=Streptomyces sp. NPDC093510 TaxID=3155199 RepID=UPI003415CECD